MGHGAQKLFGWFGGGGIDATAGFFEQAGLRPGRLHAWAGGLGEFGGGALLALGLLSPLAAAALIGVMTAAILTVHLRNGLWATKQGYEYNLVLIGVAFAVAAVGPGAWSLDNALNLDLAGAGWGLAALAAGLLGGLGAVFSGRLQHGGHHHEPTTTGGAPS